MRPSFMPALTTASLITRSPPNTNWIWVVGVSGWAGAVDGGCEVWGGSVVVPDICGCWGSCEKCRKISTPATSSATAITSVAVT